MKESIANIIRQVEEWELDDLERLQSELERLVNSVEGETCLGCNEDINCCKCFL